MSDREALGGGSVSSRPPVVVNQGGFKLAERLAAHWSSPRLISHQRDTPPWEIPHEADVLVTQAHLWAGAPPSPPPGWPFGLRFVQLLTTGVDPMPAWALEGPVVACGRGIPTAPIAEFVLASILAHEKEFDAIRVHDPSQWRYRHLGTLTGKALALAGYGAIGHAVAARARAFGMTISALARTPRWGEPDITWARDFPSLVSAADHLVLAMPLTPQTCKILDADVLALAKPTLHIVNVARGALIDDTALLAALDEGRIAAASLDVTDPEPPPAGHPFYSHPRIRLTPHISWADKTSQDRLTDKILANFDHYVRGEPIEDVVDPVRGY